MRRVKNGVHNFSNIPTTKKKSFLVSTVGNIFPSLTQFLPVAVEMDHSVHNSDNEIKSIKHPLFTPR